jgi:hypothetical protein
MRERGRPKKVAGEDAMVATSLLVVQNQLCEREKLRNKSEKKEKVVDSLRRASLANCINRPVLR